MISAASIAVAILLLVLGFVLDLKRNDVPRTVWLQALSGRAPLIIRTLLLALALTALGIQHVSDRNSRISAEKEAAQLHHQIEGLESANADLVKSNETILADLRDSVGKIAAALTYGNLGVPALDVGPHGRVDFGTVEVGKGNTAKAFYARNVGVGMCGVTVSIDETVGTGGFTTSKPTFTLTALHREDFEIVFAPSQPGNYEATVTIRGAAPCSYDTIVVVGVAR